MIVAAFNSIIHISMLVFVRARVRLTSSESTWDCRDFLSKRRLYHYCRIPSHSQEVAKARALLLLGALVAAAGGRVRNDSESGDVCQV